jgi:hypothetical protein
MNVLLRTVHDSIGKVSLWLTNVINNIKYSIKYHCYQPGAFHPPSSCIENNFFLSVESFIMIQMTSTTIHFFQHYKPVFRSRGSISGNSMDRFTGLGQCSSSVIVPVYIYFGIPLLTSFLYYRYYIWITSQVKLEYN